MCFALDFGEGIVLQLCAKVDRARASTPNLDPWLCEGCFIMGVSTDLFEGVVGVVVVNAQHGPNEWQ